MLSVTDIEATLREVVETLAPLDRTPCSPGEREAAEWLGRRFAAAQAPAMLEDEPSWGTFPPTATGLGLAGLTAVAGVVDEAGNGPRLVRRLVRRRRSTVNVIATAGEERAERTLVVLAHHDAAQSGLVFDQSAQRWLFEKAPGLMADAG